MPKYRCKYEYYVGYGTPNHVWSLVGARGGLHLHIRDNGKSAHNRYYGGIEFHSRDCGGEDRAPTKDDCDVLHCPCWHDGSSTQADEVWIPLWEAAPHDHDGMFRALEVQADSFFDDRQSEVT